MNSIGVRGAYISGPRARLLADWISIAVKNICSPCPHLIEWAQVGQAPNNRKGRLLVRRVFSAGILLLLAALISGCGETSTVQSSPTATIAPTETLQPTPVATNGAVTSDHPCIAGTSSDIQIGDLRVSHVHFANLAYPSEQLPSNLDPSKPYHAPSSSGDLPDPAVNPNMDNGYEFFVCNTSTSTSHVIVGASIGISGFSAYSGPLNSYQGCDGFYQRPFGVAGAGCGGGSCVDEYLHASFAADATIGAQVSTTQVDTCNTAPGPGTGAPRLPISLGPGQMLTIDVAVSAPTAAGTYAFAFGLNYDTVSNAAISMTPSTLLDSAAVRWGGRNCTKPALLSQIPTSDTQNRYICA